MKNQLDMTKGPIFKELIIFSVPLILSGVLQLLFNAADVIVVGRFAGDNSLAAVGSTSSFINLMLNLFIGLSIGSSVVSANYFGAGKIRELRNTVHTSMLLSIYSGIGLTILGVIFARPILHLMQAPEEVLVLAVLYLRIYFAGISATVIFNFGSALLRAKGDTKRPLYILMVAGVINVILNLIFVIFFSMDVAGVALATVISQIFAAAFVVILLMKEEDGFKLELKKLKIHKYILIHIIKIGVPAGFQGMMFSISNMVIQSSVNSFGPVVIAGSSAGINIEGFVYLAMNGFSQGALTFVSQNMGAGQKDRIKKLMFISLLTVLVVGEGLGFLVVIFARQILGIYSKNPLVIAAGIRRLTIICSTYALCGIMDTMSNIIRGIGHSLLPMVVCIVGVCVFRIVWLSTLFQTPAFHTEFIIFVSYPISWTVTFIAHCICFAKVFKKVSFVTSNN
ncbi:putative efflux protein, MATE family [Treponema sp. JC4]|uniref:MATE family efflux transporter n=1 Tax=Treponema sp. JC4 TaxID=1124982 RepID=UPI00025B05C4|nr:MATE family efflux transporter [Treponema sp. JC4]EID84047.1 putative efflux protein, MATE family [Treponema sp. JC4]